MAFKLTTMMVLKAVGLLWTLAADLRDGKLSEEELADIETKLGALVGTLEGVL